MYGKGVSKKKQKEKTGDEIHHDFEVTILNQQEGLKGINDKE